MSEALRVMFAELFFGADLSVLDAADAAVNDTIESVKKLSGAADDSSKKRIAADAKAAKSARAAATVQANAALAAAKVRESKAALAARAPGADDAAKASLAAAKAEVAAAQLRVAEAKAAEVAAASSAADAKASADAAAALAGDAVVDDKPIKAAKGSLEELVEKAKSGELGLEDLGGAMKKLGPIAATIKGVMMAFGFADAFSQNSEALRETAREARITSQELQQFQHAGAQSGVGADRMAAGVAHLATNLRSAEMRMGGGGVGGTLRRLGVDLRDSSGRVRATGDVMDDLALAFERVPSPIHRARLATQLFGESGRRMLDVLHSGPGGLRALRDEMETLGGGVTPEATEAARQYTMAQERMGRASDSLRSVLAVGLLPALSWVINRAAELGGWWARLTRGTHLVEVGLIGLGVVGTAVAAELILAMAPVIAPFVATAAAVAAAALVFDDLWTFVQGGDSALGRFIDSMFGVGTSAQYAHEVREEWEAIVDAVSRAIAAVAEFFGLGEAPSIGTLTAPRTDGRTNAPPGPSGRTRPAPRPPRVRSAGATVDAPASPQGAFYRPGGVDGGQPFFTPTARVVAAPPSVAGHRTTTITRSTHVASGAIVIHDATNPEAVGRVVRRELAAINGAQNDADHAAEDGDD